MTRYSFFESDSEVDLDLAGRLRDAKQNCGLNERALRNPLAPPSPALSTPKGRAGSFIQEDWDSESDSEPDKSTDNAEKECRLENSPQPSETLSPDYELELKVHKAWNKLDAEKHEIYRNRAMSHATRHLLELGLHPDTVERDDSD